MWRPFYDKAPNPPVTVQWPSGTTTLVEKFHVAILSGKLNRIRDIFNKGVPIDAYNEDGQTGLFCAAFKGLAEVVVLLLSLGAKPNARCQPEGYTPVHGACYFGCTQILKLLLQAGGDLRLCDSQRRTPKDWCRLQADPSKINAVISIIEGARNCVRETDGVEMLKSIQTSLSPRSNKAFVDMVKGLIGSRSSRDTLLNLEELSNGIHSTGFGKVYFGSGQRCGAVIGLPYISEVNDIEVQKDDSAPSWTCGKFTTFNPRRWTPRRTLVTVRELSKMAGNYCIPDILITELEIRGKLHHPNLLVLLGVCQTEKCESVSLVYERIQLGSLYSIFHNGRLAISDKFKTDIVIQVCEALDYVHSLGIVHCAVTSHAVMLVNRRQAKLSCFEYALPDKTHSEEAKSWRHPILTSDAHLSVLRHWMAPEVLLKQRFSVRSDIYSLACVMWELCNEEVPWHDFSLIALRKIFSDTREKLSANTASKYWNCVLEVGLRVERGERDLEIEEILYMMKKNKQPVSVVNGGMEYLYNGPQRASTDSIESSSMKYTEYENMDTVDAYRKHNGLHRQTSFSSLQNKEVREKSNSCFVGSTTPTKRSEAPTPNRSPKTLPRENSKRALHGILKADSLRTQQNLLNQELQLVFATKRLHVHENEKFYSLPHPPKKSIKPASHFLEGGPPAIIPNLSEIGKYSPKEKKPLNAGDRIESAAIKPAGHALCLQKKSQSALDLPSEVQKPRSMRRCLSYSRMPVELREAVFQPQRYFSQPMDFQRQRIPWGPCKDSKFFLKNDLDKKKGSSSSMTIERDNPFKEEIAKEKRTWHSQEIPRPLSPNKLNDSLGEFESQMKSSNVLHSTPGEKVLFLGVRLREVPKKHLDLDQEVDKEAEKTVSKGMEDKNVQTDDREADTTPADTASVHPCTTTTATATSSNTSPTTTTTNDNKESPPNSSDDVVIIEDSSGTSSDGQKSFEVNIRKEAVEGEPDDPAHTSYVIQTGKASDKLPDIRSANEMEDVDDAASELGEYDETENDYLQDNDAKDDEDGVVLDAHIDDNIEDGSREADMYETCPHLPLENEGFE